MTKERASANEPSLVEIHGDSITLIGLASALEFLMDDEKCEEGQRALIRIIRVCANRLTENLETHMLARAAE